ncbi:MAG: hypothetical protein M0C28_12140 [Candidatus Moduliflexus flocculans]|nr:hypothetical protein [Candidatus Moduliflexus flocculans]
MKYGAHCYLFTRSWSDADVRFLDLARELGLDMFELSVGDDVVFDPRLTGRRAAALGLDLVVGPGGRWPLDADLSSDERRRPRPRAGLAQAPGRPVGRARRLGLRRMPVWPPGRRQAPPPAGGRAGPARPKASGPWPSTPRRAASPSSSSP